MYKAVNKLMKCKRLTLVYRFLKVKSAKEKADEEEEEAEPSASGLPAEEKLELLLYVWKNFFWN